MAAIKDSVNDIINNVSITKIAYDLGYTEMYEGKENSKWIKLRNPSSGDTIRVKQKPYPMYFSNNGGALDMDSGNVINFVINRLGSSVSANRSPTKEQFNQALKVLKKEIGEIDIINKPKFTYTSSKSISEEDDTSKIKKRIKALEDPNLYVDNYLTKHRSIDPSILNDPIFTGTVKGSPVVMMNKKVIFNTAFVKKDLETNKTVGFTSYFFASKDPKNKQKKNIQTLKNIPWKTNLFPLSNNLIVGESEIDCLSHYELNLPKNPIYCATGGGLSEEKLNFIYDLYNKIESPNKTLTTITDNDKAGNYYDIQIAVHFNNKLNPNNPIEIIQNESQTKFILHNANNLPAKTLQDDIRNTLQNESKTSMYNSKVNVVQTKDYFIVELPRFKNDANKNLHSYLKPLSKFIFSLTEVKYYSHKPKLKDWNDVIQEKKGMKNLISILIIAII